MKKKLAVILAAAMIMSFAASCNQDSGNTSSAQNTKSGSGNAEAELNTEFFADGDFTDVSKDTPNAEIVLNGSEGTISDSTRGSSGNTVKITSKGIYKVMGSSDGVSIVVDDQKESGNIYIVLDTVTMKGDATLINVKKADKVIIQCVGKNNITYTGTDTEVDGAIYAIDDLIINGSGSLNITSSYHGIVGKDNVKVTGGEINIKSKVTGIKANDYLSIGGGTINIDAGRDGIESENSDGTSYVYMENGKLDINAKENGIVVDTKSRVMQGYALIAGGDINITAGGGADNSKDELISMKGVKCEGDIKVTGGNLNVTSADDALNTPANVEISGGTTTLMSSDDGIHADKDITVSGGTVDVKKAYEGMAAANVNVTKGKTNINSSDDGINAESSLNISDGELYVSAQGDGVDCNGSVYVTGGKTIIEGAETRFNGALDKGDAEGSVLSITGGTVLATGFTAMAKNFDAGSQPSALVKLAGSAGTTIKTEDGFSFKTSKKFECVVYSSPDLKEGSSYKITAGSKSATMDFSSGLYFSNLS